MTLPFVASDGMHNLISLDLPVTEFQRSAGSVAVHAGMAIVDTAPPEGTFAASLALPSQLRLLFGGEPALVRLRVRVEQGAVGAGVVNQGADVLLDRADVSTRESGTREIVLGIPHLRHSSYVVLMAGPGGPARVRVERASITVRPSAPPERVKTIDLPPGDIVVAGRDSGLGSASIDTPAVEGAYAAQIAIPAGLRRYYSVIPSLVRARVKVERGFAEIGVLNADGSAFLDRQHLSAQEEGVRDVLLAIPVLGNASDVVVMGSDAGAGRVRIENLSLLFWSPVPRNGSQSLDLPPRNFIKGGGGTIKTDGATTEIAAMPNEYAAHLSLPGSLRLVHTGDPALISVRLRTSKGSAGIGVLNQDGSEFLDRKALTPDDRMQMVYLSVDNIADASAVIVYGGPGPTPSRIQVESVTLAL